MKDPLPRYTVRISQIDLDKLGYISAYNGRSKNKELEILIGNHIAAFERKHGKITAADLEKLANGEKIR